MKKNIWTLSILGTILIFGLHTDMFAQVCDTQNGFAVGYRGGNASTLAVMDGVSNDLVNMYLRLKGKGANFIPTNNYSVTSNQRIATASADLNNDELVDLVEGGIGTDTNANPNDSNLSIFLSQGVDPVDSTRFSFTGPYYILYAGTALNSTYQMVSMGAGDYDQDGDADLAVMSWSGKLWIFKNLFIENGTETGGVPTFAAPVLIDNLINDGYTDTVTPTGDPHHRWIGNIASVDIDSDNDLDLIISVPTESAITRYGEIVIYVNNGAGVFSRLVQSKLINPFASGVTKKYGVTGLAVADYNGDGFLDFWCGSSSGTNIYFFKNDGLGSFSQVNSKTMTIPTSHGSCSALQAGDMDQDGLPDIVLSTDGAAGYNTPGGFVWWFKNNGSLNFTWNCIPGTCAQVSPSGDLDAMAIGDFDQDGDLDFMVADGNHSLNCYFFMNDVYDLYVSRGTVSSKNLVPCSFITGDNAIVSATIQVSENKPTGTNIIYYLSNNNDSSGAPLWEGPVTPGVEFFFADPGLFIRWKAVMETTVETTTPKIISVDLDYKFITKREYSRTSQALADVEYDSANAGLETLLYSSSFEYPSWHGHLRSWNVTSLSLAANRVSQLENIKSVGATYIADAGEVLSARSYDSRVVYTAYAKDVDGVMNDRTDFNAANVALLQNYLNLGVGSAENVPLIEFVLGKDRSWKLGDINHSSPQTLNPPAANSALMGDDYETFKQANVDRAKVILVGANDGMLHCFDPVSLEELWAFIPNNLLYKLKTMLNKDPDCGEYVSHQYFVDGTPVIQDVYINGSWHTVVVCGQGAGWGKNHGFYYFCLDVTDPLNPQPLWEVTATTMGETWSVPSIGKVNLSGNGTWVAFMGSGYDTWDATTSSGLYFYAVNIATGTILKSIPAQVTFVSPFGIANAIPGSVNIADMNGDGFDDYAYFGDLHGRLWRVDLTGGAVTDWKAAKIFQDPYKHPIITKPAIYVSTADGVIRLYFGTGGDELAPDTDYYAFICIKDSITANSVEWYLGNAEFAAAAGIPLGYMKGSLGQGEKVWADDVLSDLRVYIATLSGDIENLNPCLNLFGSSRIYSRYITGSTTGGSALIGADMKSIESLMTAQKVRSAATVGNLQKFADGEREVSKRLVFIQSYTDGAGNEEPTSQVLAQVVTGSKVVIKSWREVYKIQK